jgi:hypothetical protein
MVVRAWKNIERVLKVFKEQNIEKLTMVQLITLVESVCLVSRQVALQYIDMLERHGFIVREGIYFKVVGGKL